MLELVVRTFHAGEIPALRFQLLDDLLAIHGGYYNHNSAENQHNNHSKKQRERNFKGGGREKGNLGNLP